MSKEIEEIKERYGKLWGGEINPIQALDDIQILLSSLEREKKENTELKREIEDLKMENKFHVSNNQFWAADLEKEKEQSNYFRLEVNRLVDELAEVVDGFGEDD